MIYLGNGIYSDSGPDTLVHHGILGQKWGKRNGPPYPLDSNQMSKAEIRKNKKAEKKNAKKNQEMIRKGYDPTPISVNGKDYYIKKSDYFHPDYPEYDVDCGDFKITTQLGIDNKGRKQLENFIKNRDKIEKRDKNYILKDLSVSGREPWNEDIPKSKWASVIGNLPDGRKAPAYYHLSDSGYDAMYEDGGLFYGHVLGIAYYNKLKSTGRRGYAHGVTVEG